MLWNKNESLHMPIQDFCCWIYAPSIFHCWPESKSCIRDCRKFKVLASPRGTEAGKRRVAINYTGNYMLIKELWCGKYQCLQQQEDETCILWFDRPCSWLSGEWVSRSMQLWIWNIKYTVFFFPALFGKDWVHFQTSQRMNTHTIFHCDLLIFKTIFALLFLF